MTLKIGVYNAEWMSRMFDKDGNLETSGDDFVRAQKLAAVIDAMNLDFLGIVEGPDTLKNGNKTASEQLEKFASHFNLNPNYKGVHGHPSNGQQELCALYDDTKIKVAFTPTNDPKNNFDEPFLVDTTEKLIKEQYQHFRPPLELTISDMSDNELTRVIVAHTKSKGIFSVVDYARFEQISERDRMRLFAECMSIRMRCDDYLEAGSNVIVMGDINDGAGKDFYENRFSKSAVEQVMGDVWKPEWVLKSALPKPTWGRYGWKPSSGRYTDRITEDDVNVLIDHILISQGISFNNGKVWNSYEQQDDPEVMAVKNELRSASDHFPITVEITV